MLQNFYLSPSDVLHILVYLKCDSVLISASVCVAWSFKEKKKQRIPLLYTELCYLLSAVPLLHSVNTLAKARKCPNVGHSVFWKPSLKRVMSEPGQSRLSDSTVLVVSSDIHNHTFIHL